MSDAAAIHATIEEAIATVTWLRERVSVLERRLEAHHAISATTEDVLSYHDPRRCPICADVP